MDLFINSSGISAISSTFIGQLLGPGDKQGQGGPGAVPPQALGPYIAPPLPRHGR